MIGTWKGDKWEPLKPEPSDYQVHTEAHERGAVLVATIFDVFQRIYKYRTRDLLRIATNGTGVLPEGSISRDLVHRLAGEASVIARAFAAHLHSRARLLSTDRHLLRQLSASVDHGRPRYCAGRRKRLPPGVDRGVPGPGHFPAPREYAVRRESPLGSPAIYERRRNEQSTGWRNNLNHTSGNWWKPGIERSCTSIHKRRRPS